MAVAFVTVAFVTVTRVALVAVTFHMTFVAVTRHVSLVTVAFHVAFVAVAFLRVMIGASTEPEDGDDTDYQEDADKDRNALVHSEYLQRDRDCDPRRAIDRTQSEDRSNDR
jgi:hypothetical protein